MVGSWPAYPQVPVYQPRPAAPAPARPPVVRGQAADEPKPAPAKLVMPSPAQLGIAVPQPVDWPALRLRLARIGATGFLSEKVADGYAFACTVPTRDPDRPQRVVGKAATEAEAALKAVAQAEAARVNGW